MQSPSFEEFTAASLDEGFDEVLEREWPANAVLDTHVHPFAVSVYVVRGSYVFTVGDEVRHLKPGDRFRLARDVPHSEHYGPEGATIWVARAH